MRRPSLVPLVALSVLLTVRAHADESSAPYSVRDTTVARLALDEARAAFAAGEPARGAAELQRILDSLRDDLVALPTLDATQTRYISAPEAALRELARLPDDDRRAYDEAVAPAARALLAAAEEVRDEAGLRAVLDRYGATSFGPAAARRLAESALEAGRPWDAAAACRDGLRFAPDDRGLWLRRIDALVAAGDAAALAQLALPPTLADASLETGAGRVVLGAALAQARTTVAPAPPPVDVPAWGGDATHGRVAPWDHVLRPLRWAAGVAPRSRQSDDPPPMGRFGFDGGGEQNSAFDQRRLLATPYFPIAVGKTLVVADGFSVTSFDALSGRALWRFPDPARPIPGLAFVAADGAALRGRTNIDVAHAPAAADGLVYATLEVEDPTYVVRRLHSVEITTYRPRRVLVALDATTGALRWAMGTHRDDAKLLGTVSIGGGVAVAEGLVVAVGLQFYKRWQAFLLAFDAATGRLRWTQELVTSQQELNLFGEPVKELWAGTPAIADGTVYAPTGLGVFVAADLQTGAIRWMSSYATLTIERVDLWWATPLRFSRWGPSPTVVAGDAVLVAPAEAPHLLCFARADGRLRWREEAQGSGTPTVDHFLGVGDDGTRKVAIVTGANLRALDLAHGQVVWGNRFSGATTVRGRGAISATRVYVPTNEGLDTFSLAGQGRLLAPSPMPWPDRAQPGNLLLTPRVLVVAGGSALAGDGEDVPPPIQAFFAPEDIEREIEDRRAARPDDPGPLVELGDLWRVIGRDGKARGAYEDARRRAGAAGDAGMVDRAREGLLLLDRERGDVAAREHRVSDARASYETALASARTAAERVVLRLRLDALFRDAGVEAARVKNLQALLTEAEGERAVFVAREGLVPVRAAARFLLADVHRNADRAADAIDVLQDVLREDRAASFGGDPAAARAQRWIDAILADTGPAPYRRHELEAARRLAEAARGDDPAPFEAILAEFPNARAVPTALLGLAERQLAADRAAAATPTLARFLANYPEHPETARALALFVRALERTGSTERARAALATLERRFGDASFPWEGATTTGRAFAAVVRARLGTPQPRPPGPSLALRPEERLTEAVDGQGIGARCVEIEGRATATLALPLLLQTEDLLVAIDPATARAAWRMFLPGTAQATVAGDTLVLAASDLALGLDPASGEVRWRRELPGSAMDVGTSLGQIVVLVQQPSANARTSLVGIDPLSGAVSYRRDLPGEPAGLLLAGADGIAVVRARGNGVTGLAVAIHSPLTGDRMAEAPRAFDSMTEGSPRIVDGRMLVGLTRDGDVLRLDAVDVASGQPAWSTPLPRNTSTGWLQRQLLVADGQAVLVESTGALRTFDLATGALVGETMVAGGLRPFSARACVLLPDRLVALVRESSNRCVVAAFDRKTGKALWTPADAFKGIAGAVLLGDARALVAVLAPQPSQNGRAVGQPPEYQIVVMNPRDGAAVRISAGGLGNYLPSADLVDGTLVVAGGRRFSVYR